jgi:hypothetical protein
MASNAIVKVEDRISALGLNTARSEITEVINSTLGGDAGQLYLQRIPIPGAGSTVWQVELAGEMINFPALIGVIIAHRPERRYHAMRFDAAKDKDQRRPACMSDDGHTGYGNPVLRGIGGPGQDTNPVYDCALCSHNYFHRVAPPGGQIGKECPDRKIVYFKLADPRFPLPIKLDLPSTALNLLKIYMQGLARAMTPAYGVLTKIALLRVQSTGGIWYSKPVFSVEQIFWRDPEGMDFSQLRGDVLAYISDVQPLLDAERARIHSLAVYPDQEPQPEEYIPEDDDMGGERI